MAVMGIAPVSDAELTPAAVAGDGDAFAALYDRHERRAMNLAYRITGSRDDAADAAQEAVLKLLARLPGLADRELDFGAYLLTAVRHCSYDVLARSGRADPSDELPETARPIGAAAAPPPEDEPDRSVLLAASQEEIRAANATLAPRQREALALRELEGLSYDEIAAVMAMNRNSVAQLISRARIALRDALRRTALRSIVPGSPDCERALPLIAMRDDDGERGAAGDARWLEAHLARCERCVLGREAMAEAGASYRAWAPIAAFELLRRDTIARAGELLGHDWGVAAASASTTGSPRPAADASTTGAPRSAASAPTTGTPRPAADASTTGTPRPAADASTTGAPRSAASAPTTGTPRPAAGFRGAWRKTGNSHRFFARPPVVSAAVALCALIVAVLPARLADGEPPLPVAAAAPAATAPAPLAPAQRTSRRPTAPTAVLVASAATPPAALTRVSLAATATATPPPAPKPRPARRRADRLRSEHTATPPPPLAPTPTTAAGDSVTTVTDPSAPPPPPPADDPAGAVVVTDPPQPPPPPPPRTAGTFLVAKPPPPPPSSSAVPKP